VTSEARFAGLALAGLLLAAGAQTPAPSSDGSGAEPPPPPEVGAALLGGGRALAADGLWLETYRAWARRDLAATPALIRLTTRVDGRPLHFWLNGARMLAYDLTAWRLEAAAAAGPVPAAVRRRIASQQADIALDYLREARRRHPRSADLWIEMANIHLNLRSDPAAAADCYRAAASLPGAPYFAARVHAELLRRLGRPAEAYACLCALHPTLPPDEPAAMAGVVLARLRALESALGVPAGRRYRAPGRPR